MPELTLIAALIGGLVIMAFAGDFLVNGAVAVARRLGVSPLIAGIFIVGFGTSAPEMVVSLNAALEDRAGLA
ncbi:MAG TPA: sodium:calcium antiporter, partial [Hyphomonas sp.]|nr:sodium:calcium antiporter [Hyphomonas sp.]